MTLVSLVVGNAPIHFLPAEAPAQGDFPITYTYYYFDKLQQVPTKHVGETRILEDLCEKHSPPGRQKYMYLF